MTARSGFEIFKKDIACELRTKQILPVLFLFAALVLVLFNFAWDIGRDEVSGLFPGILWVTLLFTSLLAFSKTSGADREENRMEGLLLAPLSPAALFFGKWLTNLTFLMAVEILIFPLAVIFFDLRLGVSSWEGLLAILAGSIGLASSGSLLSAISARSLLREVFLPVLMFPVTAPLLIGSVKATAASLSPDFEGHDFSFWIRFVIGYDLIFLILGGILYEYVISD